jgi:hypothetical protein
LAKTGDFTQNPDSPAWPALGPGPASIRTPPRLAAFFSKSGGKGSMPVVIWTPPGISAERDTLNQDRAITEGEKDAERIRLRIRSVASTCLP